MLKTIFNIVEVNTLIKLINFVLILFVFFPRTSFAQCHIDDWTALKALYESTDGDNWDNNTDWQQILGSAPSSNCNLSLLYGVGFDDQGRVDSLRLSSNQLSGNIPPELGNLNNLTYLRLNANQLSGSIPLELGNLSNLRDLNLFDNQLSGSIPPELGYLNNLVYLYLSFNQLSGSIPPELGDLSNLKELSLSTNKISGSIPLELGNLSNLTFLNLISNELSSSIPSELGNLKNLKQLALSLNQLSGVIPPEFGNLSNLEYLSMRNNQLSGSIPEELGSLSNLTDLRLYNNQLSGNLPSELGNLNNLTGLYLFDNQLSGSISPELGNLINLTQLELHNNQLTGIIFPQLGNLSNLVELRLNNNQFSGNIPPQLGNLNNLTGLFLNNNKLVGNLPAEVGNLSNLEWLVLFNNQLNGCYSNGLSMWCNNFDNTYISNGNNFDASWEDFCATGAGTCIDDCEADCEVYPGDLNHDGIVNNQDVSLFGLFQYQPGTPRAPEHQNINWSPHPSQDWGITNNQNKDLKHHDCNGDGVIDTNDQQAISNNMGLSWQPVDPTPPPAESDYQVMLHPTDQIYDGYLVMNVALERRIGGDLTLQGGHFTIDYSDVEGDFLYVGMDFLPISWLGVRNNNIWFESNHITENKRIEVGFTKTNNTDSEGKGVIGQLILEYDNSNLKKANTNYQFEVYTIGVHRNSGNFIPIEDQLLQVNLTSLCQANWDIDEETPFQNLYQSNGAITTNGFVLIGEDQEVEYNANRVRMNAGFSVRADADFKVRSSGCN